MGCRLSILSCYGLAWFMFRAGKQTNKWCFQTTFKFVFVSIFCYSLIIISLTISVRI